MMHFLCWLFGGHETILRTDRVPDGLGSHYIRTWTECLNCGHESRGWSYGDSYVGPRP